VIREGAGGCSKLESSITGDGVMFAVMQKRVKLGCYQGELVCNGVMLDDVWIWEGMHVPDGGGMMAGNDSFSK
jgi:hypothetical protein